MFFFVVVVVVVVVVAVTVAVVFFFAHFMCMSECYKNFQPVTHYLLDIF